MYSEFLACILNFWQAPMSLEYTIQCLIQTSPTLVSVLCDPFDVHTVACRVAQEAGMQHCEYIDRRQESTSFVASNTKRSDI